MARSVSWFDDANLYVPKYTMGKVYKIFTMDAVLQPRVVNKCTFHC